MPFCLCDSLKLYYEIHGKGRPLLFISGLGGASSSWYGQIPYFSRHYQTIVFDNQGAGLSDMPPGPYSISQFAADVLCLMDHLDVKKAFVLGLSMGGMIAQEFALQAPQRVKALVLGCTHCGGTARISPSSKVMAILLDNEGLSQEQIIDKNLPLFFSESFRNKEPQEVELYRQENLRRPVQPDYAFQAQFEAIRKFDCSDRLSQITAPTLILTGTKDVLVPPENSTFLSHHIPESQLVEIQGAGHALHVESRDLLNHLVHQFFQRHVERFSPQ